jgi:hypothetical protein
VRGGRIWHDIVAHRSGGVGRCARGHREVGYRARRASSWLSFIL